MKTLPMVMPGTSSFPLSTMTRATLEGLAKDLARRGVRAIEAFGDAKWDGPACVLPAQFLLSVGFKTVRPHHRWPRLRMDLRSAVSWREDVEVALDRLLGQRQGLRPSEVP